MKYTYNVGIYDAGIKVSVNADNEEDAYRKACIEMDDRYEYQGKEPPVAWTLVLIGEE